jgi:integrase
VSIVIVSHRLGHSSPSMTLDRYSHMFAGDLDRAAAVAMSEGGLDV